MSETESIPPQKPEKKSVGCLPRLIGLVLGGVFGSLAGVILTAVCYHLLRSFDITLGWVMLTAIWFGWVAFFAWLGARYPEHTVVSALEAFFQP
ncbi:hypothetical protein [Calycomorphotria hydatis]|uniref:Uncharacterized protein n=1 Tax=Calycomorphotria hydatis TaxID=2528027 RepID=A0A517T3J6_9PLAN|nr:hypothetical protein [Calycomorphotria hydatis]QDT62952.1 hypothetical protein V22_01500 [Calycomorphotria hydatis]